MSFSRRLLLLALFWCVWSASGTSKTSSALACFAIVAGRKATADGSVLVGHNEQDRQPCLISFDRITRQPLGQAVPEEMRYSRRRDESGQTAAYLWSQCVGHGAADSFLNEYGVAVVSDKCPSREDSAEAVAARGELRDGGIGYLLRRLVAQQATTAREGVEIAGELVERFGYTPSGRTYVIADPNEAWLLALVGGRRWVAQRVPDDAVVAVPNVHVIRGIDLTDKANFLGSADLIEYAIGRGWYHPAADGAFDFRKVYRDIRPPEDDSADHGGNHAPATAGGNGAAASASSNGQKRTDEPDPRQWRAQCLITGQEVPWPPKEPQPFSVRPREPMTVASVIAILRDRDGQKPISADTTVEATVFQLRRDLPREVGCVYWRATCEPTTSVLTPWYLGISRVPGNYHEPASLAQRMTLDYQFHATAGTFEPRAGLAWWTFKTLQDRVHEDYAGRVRRVRAVWDPIERRLLAEQEAIELEAMRLWKEDREAAGDYLTRHCAEVAASACREADRLAALFGPPQAARPAARPHAARQRQTVR